MMKIVLTILFLLIFAVTFSFIIHYYEYDVIDYDKWESTDTCKVNAIKCLEAKYIGRTDLLKIGCKKNDNC